MLDEKIKKEQSYKSMFMFGMFSIVMLFAGLTSAYIVSKGFLGDKWETIELPKAFLYSTIVIVMSSICLFFSVSASKQKKEIISKRLLVIAMILGFAFLFFQYNGWKNLVANGYFFVNTDSPSQSSAYIYVFSGLHLIHILVGLFFLLQSFLKIQFKVFVSETFFSLKLKSWFWHFLAFLWIYLYCFLSILN